ncbi:RNA polymerase sigma-70 factor [Paraflavitalea pollutisoli]|uniref:RNA polymerase sigma-70 factor n=1 Tax=Paraflavitalea pollutisoli TaxID=3034143 RepID=UPI0023EDCA97|nr:RNA polymerase sigma-70 factor [Paraflavitalea sp. H1-2-19X]
MENYAACAFKTTTATMTAEAHYRQYFYTYFERLFGYAFTMVKDNAEAKDIVQSAFLKLWEKRSSIDLPNAGRAYLYTTVYHLSLNAIRNRAIRKGHHAQLADGITTVHVHTAEEAEIRERIRLAIETLPPRCREVFCKSRLEGKKYDAIAAELDISVKTVEAQMSKALKLLRTQLSDLALTSLVLLFIR